MPAVRNVRPVEAAEAAGRSPRLATSESYMSPDGRFELVLRKSDEIRMGLAVWTEVRLLQHGADLTRSHQALIDVVGNSVLPQSCFVPWDASSSRLILGHLVHDGEQLRGAVLIYDVSKRAILHQTYSYGWPRSLAWSPRQDVALLLTDDGARLVTSAGESRFISTRIGASIDVGGWTSSGSYAFFMARARGGSEIVRFMSPEKEEMAVDCTIDPSALVAYDAGAYQRLGRQSYVLVTGRGERSIGELLDRWSVGQFDPSTQTLSLGVMRPTSEVRLVRAFAGPGGPAEELGCSAELRWIDADVVE